MDGWLRAEILAGGIATIAIYSFLWKENPFYRFFEHLFIGMGVGIGIVVTVRNFMWPKAFQPIIGATAKITCWAWGVPIDKPQHDFGLLKAMPYVLYLAPLMMGFLYYAIYSKRYRWMARIVIGFSLGMGGGLAFKGFFAEYLPQIIKSFKPLVVWQANGSFDWMESFNNIVLFFTLTCVMSYFFFSFDHDLPVIKQASYSGRWLMMVSFGAFFGATVMARMALLVERLQFLIEDWAPAALPWLAHSGGGGG